VIDLEQLLDDAAAGVPVGPAPEPSALRSRAGVNRRRPALALVGVAAAVAVSIVGVTVATGPKATRDPGGPRPSQAGHPFPTVTDADNRRAAEAAATRLTNSLPLPDRAVRLHGQPAGWPEGGQGMSPSDPSLEQVSWYTVPGSVADYQSHLADHPPAGMSISDGGGASGRIRTLSFDPDPQQNTTAYRGPWLLVDVADVGGTTTVKFDVVVVARWARTAATYLDGTVTSVDVERTLERTSGKVRTQSLSPVHLTAEDDAAAIDRLVAGFNALSGTVINKTMHSCMAFEDGTSYRFVFHTSQGDVVYLWPSLLDSPDCDPRIEVVRDNRPVLPPLDPNGPLLKIVGQALAGSGVGNGS
jgi:hypothetical protein